MLGFRYVKSQPTTHVLRYRHGRLVAEGAGLSFLCFAPATTVVAVPLASAVEGFVFGQVTADFQTVTVQGQVTFRIAEPRKAAALLDYTLRADGQAYETTDPELLAGRVVRTVEVLSQQVVKDLDLRQALLAADTLAARIAAGAAQHADLVSLGVAILDVSVVAIKPTPETARALEAEAREKILGAADDAVFVRRHAAVANERAIRESELDTEVAVEQKKRTIRETQLEAEASLRKRKQELRAADMAADIQLEEARKELVARAAANTRTLAEADAYRVATAMDALKSSDPRIVQALATSGMQPGQIIAQAFGGIAERAERIGQLNVSPDLLQQLLAAPGPAAGAATTTVAGQSRRPAERA